MNAMGSGNTRMVVKFSYSAEGKAKAVTYLRKNGRDDLVDLWWGTWQEFMVIFEANVLYRGSLIEKKEKRRISYGAAKRKTGDS